MKGNIVLIVIIFALLAVFVLPPTRTIALQFAMQSPCDTPITYRLGAIDPRFNITSEIARQDITQAVQLWNQTEGRELFREDPKGELTVSFVYDQRQELNSQIQNEQDQLHSQQQNLQAQIDSYEKDSAAFRQKIEALNAQIDHWNKQGGAPPETYKQLVSEQQSLQGQAEELNLRAKQLNLTTRDYNTGVGILNNDVKSFNEALSKKPEEGLYDPNLGAISIYFITNREELVHTLAHEFGHALGIQHVPDPNAVMYPLTNDSIRASQNDLDELTRVCKKELVFNIWADKIAKYIRKNYIKIKEK